MSYDMKAVASPVYKIDGNMIPTFSKALQGLKNTSIVFYDKDIKHSTAIKENGMECYRFHPLIAFMNASNKQNKLLITHITTWINVKGITGSEKGQKKHNPQRLPTT